MNVEIVGNVIDLVDMLVCVFVIFPVEWDVLELDEYVAF